jgi:hypothetical protein
MRSTVSKERASPVLSGSSFETPLTRLLRMRWRFAG